MKTLQKTLLIKSHREKQKTNFYFRSYAGKILSFARAGKEIFCAMCWRTWQTSEKEKQILFFQTSSLPVKNNVCIHWKNYQEWIAIFFVFNCWQRLKNRRMLSPPTPCQLDKRYGKEINDQPFYYIFPFLYRKERVERKFACPVI